MFNEMPKDLKRMNDDALKAFHNQSICEGAIKFPNRAKINFNRRFMTFFENYYIYNTKHMNVL